MKTKIVTAIWMDVAGYPFQGTSSARKPRYYGSLTSHCKGTKLPVVCYTHERNLNELEEIKKEFQLDNLTIKLLELSDMKLHKRINEVREKKFDTDLDGRGPEIMWGKFDVLERELEGYERVYWVDAGLQHPGIFPWRFCVPYGDISFHRGGVPAWANNEISQFDFTKIFNRELFDKLDSITNDKVVTITATEPQTGYRFYEFGITKEHVQPPYPIAGMIGGDTKILKNYIDSFWVFANKALDNNFLCTEESVMKVVFDNFEQEKLLTFKFSAHATNEHDQFHFELWNESWNKPKPLYMVWYDILNHS
jgi:hypothetical protein